MIDFACVRHRARIVGASPAYDAPNDFRAMLTPMFEGEDPVSHYSAALRPLPQGQSEDWFVLELPRERRIETLEIDWCRADLAGCEFTLEWGDGDRGWTECLREEAGYQRCRRAIYRRDLDGTVTARFFRFRLFRSLGQNRLLIRRFSLLGPGPAPRHVLMLAPDCHMVDRRILQEARSLIEAGYRVTLVAGGECPREEHYFQDGVEIHRYQYDWDDERIKNLRKWIPTAGLRRLFHRAFVGFARRFLPFNSFDMFIYNRARKFPADVVHAHDLPFLKHGARLAREWGAPLIFDAHEIYYEQEVLSPALRKRLLKEEKRHAPQTQIFITVNDAIANCFRETHGDLNYLVLMNCADRVDAVDRAASRRKLREMAGLKDKDRIVLFQGWISAERNLDTLVRAAKELPKDAYLVFIGYGEYQADLEKIATADGTADKVRFLGRVEPNQILPLTAGADLGVIPYQPIDLNHKFCSPNKFFEYVQARVPMVTHDLEFFRRMNELHGVVATGDLSTPEGTARAINGLLNSPGRLEELTRRCETASLPLSWAEESKKLVEAYAKYLN